MAVDATGTPTTNYAIPTYNTAVDSPSGDGFNATMTAIDTAMKTKNDSQDALITALQASGVTIGLVVALG